MSRPLWNEYMREYRKRDYVKKKTHEYYIKRIIKQAKEDNEKGKWIKVLGENLIKLK